MDVDFLSGCNPYVPATPFRKWAESALPGVYDESLSLYELMAKLLKYFGDVIESVDGIGNTSNSVLLSFVQLKQIVEQAAADMDVERRVDDKLAVAAEDGTLQALIQTIIDNTNALKRCIPYVGSNGNWWVDGSDTGAAARGELGPYYKPEVFVGDNVHGLFSINFHPSVKGMPHINATTIPIPAGQVDEEQIKEIIEDYLNDSSYHPNYVTPTITVEHTDNGAVITITDNEGAKSVALTNGKDYTLTDDDVQDIAQVAATLVDVPTGGSSAWELLHESVIQTQVNWMEIKTFDLTKGEYLVAILAPQVETAINSAYSRLFGQRGVRTHSLFATTAGKMLHMFYAKKIAENEALYIGYEAERSEGFQDAWGRTNKTAVLYGGFNASEGLNISNVVPVGTHIKIYGK